MSVNLINQKSVLRKFMKDCLRKLSPEVKEHQSRIVIDYLLNKCERFKKAKHIALYLAMKYEEVDTIPLIEKLLETKENQTHIYVPYVQMKDTTNSQMKFYELTSIQQYRNELNDNNKFKLMQFNSVENLPIADQSLFDLIIVPGLAFDLAKTDDEKSRKFSRLGRGKGYYDAFLATTPNCYTIGVGFNQQYLPFNQELMRMSLPFDETRDQCLDEFICEKLTK